MDRQVADSILRLTETNRYLPGLRAWVGFNTEVIFYDRVSRASGEPKQTLSRLINDALDAIFSFSYKPLRVTLAFGMGTAVVSILIGVFLIFCRIYGIGLFGSPLVYGYTSTLVFILLLAGVQLTSIGILGECIGRIYDEVKRGRCSCSGRSIRPSGISKQRSRVVMRRRLRLAVCRGSIFCT